MAEAKEFDEFVTVRSARLLRLAYLLTQDHALAEDLLQTALTRSWSAWKRLDGDPEPYVRRVLVNAHNSWWRRRSSTEQPVDELPVMALTAPQSEVDDRDQVWRALGRLPQQQRAVLVLRYFEDMTEEQIAGTLGLATGTVKSYAAKGLAKLRVDPTLSTLPLPEPVETPAGTERLVAVRERIRRRSRDKIVAAAAALGVVVALVLGYALAPHLRDLSAPPVPADGGFSEYIRGYRVVASGQSDFANAEGTSFEWTPTTLDIGVFFKCTHDEPGVTVRVAALINDIPVSGADCAGGTEFRELGVTGVPQTDLLRRAGVQVGRPATVSMVLQSQVTSNSIDAIQEVRRTLRLHGLVAVAIGERIDFEAYSQPSRPAVLKPLEQTFNGSEAHVVIDSTGSHDLTLRWDDRIELYARAQTPGTLTVKVNGTVLEVMTWLGYGQGGWGATLSRDSPGMAGYYGQTITISVEPAHMTGDWYVAIWPV